MAFLGIAVSYLALVAAHGVVGSFVLSHLWNWFAVPVLGARPLGMAGAFGLMLIWSHMQFKAERKRNEATKEWSETVVDVANAVVAYAAYGAFLMGLGHLVRGAL